MLTVTATGFIQGWLPSPTLIHDKKKKYSWTKYFLYQIQVIKINNLKTVLGKTWLVKKIYICSTQKLDIHTWFLASIISKEMNEIL